MSIPILINYVPLLHGGIRDPNYREYRHPPPNGPSQFIHHIPTDTLYAKVGVDPIPTNNRMVVTTVEDQGLRRLVLANNQHWINQKPL